MPHHNVNIINPVTKDSRYWEAIGFVGLIDQQHFISNDVFLAQLAVTDPLGLSPLLDKSLALIFCYSDMIRNGEIKHINKNEFNFYALNGKLIRYTRKDEESGERFSTNYKYNKQGNLSSIRGEEGNYTFQYDKNGKLVSFISEEADDGAPFELVFKIKRNADGRIASVNDCPYSYYDNGMLRELDTYNGTLQNGIGQNRGEIVSFYYNDDNSANAAFLHYTTI